MPIVNKRNMLKQQDLTDWEQYQQCKKGGAIMGKKTGYVCILLLIMTLFACATQLPTEVFSENERIVELSVPGCV